DHVIRLAGRDFYCTESLGLAGAVEDSAIYTGLNGYRAVVDYIKERVKFAIERLHPDSVGGLNSRREAKNLVFSTCGDPERTVGRSASGPKLIVSIPSIARPFTTFGGVDGIIAGL